MASNELWLTQSVTQSDDEWETDDDNLEAYDELEVDEGPVEVIEPDQVSKEPDPLIDGLEWATLDLGEENDLQELYDLLTSHYVEDDEEMFRLNYSPAFLNWALRSPGWKKEWHVGIRESKSQRLIATILGIPAEIRVRQQMLTVVEINFLCVHKDQRSRQLTPAMFKEIKRRCGLDGVQQALYTAGVVLKRPISCCRYYHRPLDWQKLYDVEFSPLPVGSTAEKEIEKWKVHSFTATPNLRPMQAKDIDHVHGLLNRYLNRFSLVQVFTREEVEHWFLHDDKPGIEQVVWSYVVEESETHKVTDFISFYSLRTLILDNPKHSIIHTAYLYYYASETAFSENEESLKERLVQLVSDAIILAKAAHFDVFNALTIQDNPLFLKQTGFGSGSGDLYYYLLNYSTASIAGGVNERGFADERKRDGIGMVLL